MQYYILRRLAQMLPVLFGLTIIVFTIVRLRGDPVMQFVPADASPAEIEVVRKAYGFDRPLLEQYFTFVSKAVQGDFGTSFRYKEPALSLVVEKMPVTIWLTLISLVIAVAIALPAGVISALRQNSALDLAATSVSVIGRAMPNYWLGILLILLFSVQLRWLPVSGSETWVHYVLPAATLGVGTATTLTRLIRSSMLAAGWYPRLVPNVNHCENAG